MHRWDSSLDECASALHVFSRIKVRFSSWWLYHSQTGASIKSGGGGFLGLLHSLVLGGELHLRRDQRAEPAAEQPSSVSMVSTWKPTKWRHHQKQSRVLNLLDSTCSLALRAFFCLRQSARLFCISTARNQANHLCVKHTR